jgi:hypothetical protein
MVVAHLLAATLCFSNTCYPMLAGRSTPVGEYQIVHYRTDQPGYGGDILVFKESPTTVFAIHRVYVLHSLRRITLLEGPPKGRQIVTNGCINVMPEVYQQLVSCCSTDKLVIERN